MQSHQDSVAELKRAAMEASVGRQMLPVASPRRRPVKPAEYNSVADQVRAVARAVRWARNQKPKRGGRPPRHIQEKAKLAGVKL